MLLTWASQQQFGNDPFADYPLALDFKNQDYWFGGTKYALSDLPGYTFTDNVDNIPNIDGTGYHSTTAEISRLSALVNPIINDTDHIWWVTVTFDATTNGNYEVSCSTSDGHYLGRNSDGSYAYSDDGIADRSAQDVCPAGRSALLLRRRAGKGTFAYKRPDNLVYILPENAVSAFGTPTYALNIGMFKNAVLQPNAKIEGVFVRTGTFSDTDILTILEPA